MTTTPTRPVLRYFGGKWLLAPWIISHFPPHRVYTEAFGGAASVLMRKARSKVEVYNDLDGRVVNLFRVLRDRGDELRRLLELTPYAREEYELSQEPADDPLEQARRDLVRSWFSIGTDSILRKGDSGGFRCYTGDATYDVPANYWPELTDTIPTFTSRLRGVLIENDDAAAVLTRNDYPDALHYADPPYVPDTRSSGGYRHDMTAEQHEALAETLHSLQGMVVLSGYASDLYDALYGDWQRIDRTARADSREARIESLWLNPAAQERKPQPTLFEVSA